MDELYKIKYTVFNRYEYKEEEKTFDNLTEAIQEVNRIANGPLRYEYIHLVWGYSLLLELYGD